MQKLTIIDFSSLIYSASYNISKIGSKYFTDYTNALDRYLGSILRDTEAEYYLVFIDNNISFRKALYPSYKANRVKTYQPFLVDLTEYSKVVYGAYYHEGIEADDLCLIHQNELQNSFDITVAFKDKDLLQQKGKFFDYKCYKNNTDPKEAFISLTEEAALYHLYKQVLIGDSVDNISGLYKCGEKSAEFYLTKYGCTLNSIINAFINGIPREEGLKNSIPSSDLKRFYESYNLVYLLKTCHEAGLRGFPLKLIEPLKIRNNDTL